jgi:hypothetical protein
MIVNFLKIIFLDLKKKIKENNYFIHLFFFPSFNLQNQLLLAKKFHQLLKQFQYLQKAFTFNL